MKREEAGKGPYDSMHVWQSHMVCMHHGGRKLNQGNGNLIEDTLSTNRKNSHPYAIIYGDGKDTHVPSVSHFR